MDTVFVLANFGGPRSLKEVRSFLTELLTDPDVIRPTLPKPLHNALFRMIAKKRSVKVAKDYMLIGNGSPIYFDTECSAKKVAYKSQIPTYTFHRYLTATHPAFCEKMEGLTCKEIRIFPMFPQFSYATTGSIARFFTKRLSSSTVEKMRWIPSYETDPLYISLFQKMIQEYLQKEQLLPEETFLLFSAHGLPARYVQEGDPYEKHCRASFGAITSAFPQSAALLSFQSKFGWGKWLAPYTIDCCREIRRWSLGRQNILFIPLSFTSDHIETLFEIEHLYMPVIRKQGFHPYRLPAIHQSPSWSDLIEKILLQAPTSSNPSLLRS